MRMNIIIALGVMCLIALALALTSQDANADSRRAVAHCVDLRTNTIKTFTGTRDTIQEVSSHGQVAIKFSDRTVYYPSHSCIVEFYK